MSLYPAALVIALLPLLGGLAQAWSAGAGWLFTVVQVMVDNGPFLLAGMVLALLTAVVMDDRKVVKRLGLSALIVGVLEVILVGILLVESLMAPPNVATGRAALDFGITHRMIEAVLFALALVGLGFGARKALGRLPERDPAGRRTSDRISL